MLKQCVLTLMLAGLVYTVTPSATAQDNGAGDPQSAPAGAPPEHGRGGPHMDPARRTGMLTKKLNLNSDQQAKVLDILKSAQSQAESVRSDSSVPQADRHSRMMEIHKTADEQIRGLLNPGQQSKFDEMQARHQREGQSQPPPPSSQQ